MGAFELQPSRTVNIKKTATKTPCFMTASGLFIVFHNRRQDNHILLLEATSCKTIFGSDIFEQKGRWF